MQGGTVAKSECMLLGGEAPASGVPAKQGRHRLGCLFCHIIAAATPATHRVLHCRTDAEMFPPDIVSPEPLVVHNLAAAGAEAADARK
jgi:hypothetical protein